MAISGIIERVNSNDRTAIIKLRGKTESEQKPYIYPKIYIGANIPSIGDEVAVDNIDGSYRIIAIY